MSNIAENQSKNSAEEYKMVDVNQQHDQSWTLKCGTDQTPSYWPEREDWDMQHDPPLPQPTPRTPGQVFDPDDMDFMKKYLEIQNFDPLHVVRLVRNFVPPELDRDNEEEGPDFLTDESGGRLRNGFGLCNHPVKHSRSLSDREAAGTLLIDLSTEHSHASFLVRNHILKAIIAVVDKSAAVPEEAKLVEQGISVLANITKFDILSKKVAMEPELKQSVMEKALCRIDSDVLIQVFRFLTIVLNKEGCEQWITVARSETCLEQLMWIMDNTLNDTLLEHGFRFIDCLMTVETASIKQFLELNILDLLVSIFNTYVVKQSGLDSDTTLSPGTQLMVARKLPSLSGETVICATQALYSSTEVEEAVATIDSHSNLLMCVYHVWLVSDYDRLDDQLLLVMATLNRPLKQMMYDTKGVEKLIQVAHFDYNSNAPEVQMSAIWAVLSFLSHGLRLEAESNRNMKRHLRIVTREVRKLTGQKILPSCMQFAQCFALNLIATVDSELIKVKEAFQAAETKRGKRNIMGWWHRYESTKRTLAEWLQDALGGVIEGG